MDQLKEKTPTKTACGPGHPIPVYRRNLNPGGKLTGPGPDTPTCSHSRSSKELSVLGVAGKSEEGRDVFPPPPHHGRGKDSRGDGNLPVL